MTGVDDDSRDLHAYARARDEAALARVIRRHADRVYSACLRQVRDPGLAEDAAQAVFILLTRKAGTIRSGAVLAGWLFNVARYASRTALRGERRRRQYEREAAVRVDAVADPRAVADEIDPRLDEALARLGRKDRQAVLLRFFHDQSHEEIARSLGTTAHAAKMRVSRAVEKLRGHLASRGINVAPGVLEPALLATAARAAPAGFADVATQAALGAPVGPAGIAIAGATAGLLTARKVAAVAALGVVVIAATAGGTALALRDPPHAARAAAPAASHPTSPPAAAGAQTAFDAAYALPDGDAVRWIRPPYVDARRAFLTADDRGRRVPGADAAAVMELEWDPEARRVAEVHGWFSAPWRFERQLVNLVGLTPAELDIPPSMLHIDLPGDWVFRRGATAEEKLASFHKALAGSPAAFHYEKKLLRRDVIVVRGTLPPPPPGDAGGGGGGGGGRTRLRFNVDLGDPAKPPQGGDVTYFVRIMTMKLGRPLVNEWAGSERAFIQWPASKDFRVRDLTGERQDARLRHILKSMSEQLGVELTPEQREIETYVIRPTGAPAE